METEEAGRGLGRVESVWETTSVMKWRSDGDCTLGTTRVVRLGDLSCRVSVSSADAVDDQSTYDFLQISQCKPAFYRVDPYSSLPIAR